LRAASALIAVARTRGVDGQAEILAVAARYTAAGGDASGAEALWREVADQHPESPPAPMAILALARAMAARGETAQAVTRLEGLILQYPQSALVPEARRELDRVRNLVPRNL
jgi:outer membrane protein assembly factor BamD (BamD/ComL family)